MFNTISNKVKIVFFICYAFIINKVEYCIIQLNVGVCNMKLTLSNNS